MATVAKAVTRITSYGDEAHVITWGPLTTANADGEPVEMPGSADRSIQFQGTFGAGGTIRIEGSNDGVSWHPLTDPQGTDISKTVADLEAISELTRYIRPFVSAGDGTTSLTATLLVKRR